MYCQLNESITQIDAANIQPDILTIGLIPLEELEKTYQSLGFSETTVMECKYDTHIHGNLDLYQDYLFGIIFGINSRQMITKQDRIGLYIKEHLFLIVIIEDEDHSVELKFQELLEHLKVTKLTMERVIFSFLERLISNDYDLLEHLEDKISSHEDKINAQITDHDFNHKITQIRKKLLLLDNYYQQLIAFGEELEENSADLFLEENLTYFRIFTDRVTRLSNNTRMLQDYSIHVREAYHAQLDYSLNSIMKLFTVVTTIFLPLTLIVGWYGMNFTSMPELTWKYGYIFVIALSVVVAAICIIFFKKKKFL